MSQVNALVLRTAGTNCDQETCHAFNITGAAAQTVHVNQLIGNPSILSDYQILAIAGGFSYGDDIAAGRILANQLIHHFSSDVRRFIDDGKLVIGICNGFQVLVKAGILPGLTETQNNVAPATQATITYNDCGKFEDRWVDLQPATAKCVFIDPNRRITLPIAHGEGKVCFADTDILDRVKASDQVAFRYVDQDGSFGDFPINPNGSTDHIAALTDPTGRVLGMMPHPERFVHPTHHPRWTRLKHTALTPPDPDGLSIFKNAVNYFS